MKIGLIIYGNLNTVSGGYRYDRMLVHVLRSAGHAVEVLALPWRSYPVHLADNARLLWARAITRRGYDLLLQDELNHPSLCLLTRYWHWSLGCPQIAIVHHLRSSEQHATWQLPIYRAVERAYLRGVDGFIFNSCTTARSVRALAKVERPEHIAYPAADHILPPPRSAIAARLARRATAGGPLRVIFVGNVIPRKGLHHLLAGLAKLPHTAWTLDIVGQPSADPAYTAGLRAAIDAHGLAPHVGWHGRVRDALLRQRLAEADVLAVPSYEGFGIVYLEAMAYGLPVLAADVGAAWEIVTHGVDGFLIAPGDAAALAASLQSLAGDPGRLTAMSLAARARYERHGTWASTMSCCEQWLREAYER